MEELIQKIASSLDVSVVTAALVLGFIAGFIFRSLFSRRNKSLPPMHAARSTSHSNFTDGTAAQFGSTGMSQPSGSKGLSQQQTDAIRLLLAKGDKIQAIKMFREITNTGLAEAKSA